MTATIPVAYIRRSARRGAQGEGEVSREAQEAAVRELAHRDGYNGQLIVFTDWGRSGDEAKIGKRPEYARMLRMVEAGEVAVVYAYALDRLHRSVISTTRLVKAAEQYGVRIVTQREGEVRNDSPDEWLRWTILSTFGEYELRIAKARAKSATATRRANGDYLGVPPYGSTVKEGRLVPNRAEDVGIVIDAYRRAGSYLGAAKLLTAEGVPSRHGMHWSEQTIYRILVREGVELPARGSIAARMHHGWRLAGLLTCPVDNRRLTPTNLKHPTYFCGAGRRDPAHPRPYSIAESKALPWVMAEASRLRVPVDVVELGDPSAERAALEARREDVGWAVANRAMSRETATAEIERIEAELDALGAAESLATVPQAIDWGWEPKAISEVLHALFENIELDADMKPIKATWKVPEWRGESVESPTGQERD